METIIFTALHTDDGRKLCYQWMQANKWSIDIKHLQQSESMASTASGTRWHNITITIIYTKI